MCGRRHHGVAEPQSRKQRFVEGSDVDDTLGFIETLKRGEWAAAISEFTGVVAPNNPCATSRPCKKFEAARHRQDDAFRKLVRRRYENGTRFCCATDTFCDIDAMLVDRYRADLRARRDHARWVKEYPGSSIHTCLSGPCMTRITMSRGLLCARGDHNLLRVTPHGPRGLEIGTHGLAEFQHTVGIGVAKMMPSEGPQAACAEFSPQLSGACIHECPSEIERALFALRRHIAEAAKLTRGGCGFAARCGSLLAGTNCRKGLGRSDATKVPAPVLPHA